MCFWRFHARCFQLPKIQNKYNIKQLISCDGQKETLGSPEDNHDNGLYGNKMKSDLKCESCLIKEMVHDI